MEANGNPDPFIKADLHVLSGETLQLFSPAEQEVYEGIIDEIARTGRELNEALGQVAIKTAAHQYALNKRDAFFRGNHGI